MGTPGLPVAHRRGGGGGFLSIPDCPVGRFSGDAPVSISALRCAEAAPSQTRWTAACLLINISFMCLAFAHVQWWSHTETAPTAQAAHHNRPCFGKVPVKIPGKALKFKHLDTKQQTRFYLLWEKAFFCKELMSSCGLIFLFLFLKQVDDEKSQNSMTIMRMISKAGSMTAPHPQQQKQLPHTSCQGCS